ncbi:hypothetical protein O181_039556 [Austropuccinia psidii MF-1]|uniref:Uncharacterized protein n=1 Tax=Austropuccinia psidii MF-1 TaxID=1389203 RepID=A0A9Q3HCM5_9BASI|nr:hypothetical protein [Austropuccinia psidii MF-1]
MAHKLGNSLEPGDLVLAYNKPLESQWVLLFKNCCNGPYEIEELNGTTLRRKFAESHIKRLYPRGKIVQTSSESENKSRKEIEAEDSIFEGDKIEQQN